MLVSTITQTDSGALQVHCCHHNISTIIPLDLDQWELVKQLKLVGQQVYVREIIKGGAIVAHVSFPSSSFSGSLTTKEDAEEFARQAFYEGREVSRIYNGIAIFKNSTFNEWLRQREQRLQKDPKENSKA